MRIIHLLCFVFCFLFLNTIIAQTESLPADFPKYVNTGNPEKDDAVYAAQKKAWYASHPDRFQKENPTLGSASQLQSTYQNAGNANYQVEPLRSNYITPENFPTYKKTGNIEKDKADYEVQKLEWIENNIEKYDKLSPEDKAHWFGEYNATMEKSILAGKAKYAAANSDKVSLEPSLIKEEISPEYREKLLWILANEGEYRKMVGDEMADIEVFKAKQNISEKEINAYLVTYNTNQSIVYDEKDRAKYLWILEHQAEYRKMNPVDADRMIVIARKIFNK